MKRSPASSLNVRHPSLRFLWPLAPRICSLSIILILGGCADLGNGPGSPGEAQLVHKGGSTPYRHAISFVDASNGWIVGDSGLVERTTDGGKSWSYS